MKKIFHSQIIILYLGLTFLPKPIIAQSKLEGQITISGAFALYPMTVRWAEEFKKIHLHVKIDISAGGAGKGITDVLNNMVDIGMVSREIYPEELKNGAFAIAVTKDAVVPVVSAANPALNEILSTGLKKDAGNDIWITGKIKSWSQAFSIKKNIPMHIYTRSDACGAAEVWAKYFGKKQEDLLGSGVFGDPGLALAVKKDPLGIGFNNIGYTYDNKTRKQVSGISVVPLDLNNNGKVDSEENFYSTMDEIVNAIATGKYPTPPARELFFVTQGKPTRMVLKEFIRWVLTEGQKYVQETGYIGLSKEIIERDLRKIN